MSNQPITWPFPINDGHAGVSIIPTPEVSEKQSNLKPTYSIPGVYKIQLGGRGTELAIGTITQEQYDFWSHPDHEPYIGIGLCDPDAESYENDKGEEVIIPEECLFGAYYNEFSDVIYVSGSDYDSSWITITDPNNVQIYDGDFNDFMAEVSNLFIEDFELIRSGEEMCIDDCSPGQYVFWAQGGKGMYFEGDVEISAGSQFDLRKLAFVLDEIDGNQVIGSVMYEDDTIENYGGDWSGKYDDYTIFEIPPYQDD